MRALGGGRGGSRARVKCISGRLFCGRCWRVDPVARRRSPAAVPRSAGAAPARPPGASGPDIMRPCRACMSRCEQPDRREALDIAY
jgi:hypothetical protein